MKVQLTRIDVEKKKDITEAQLLEDWLPGDRPPEAVKPLASRRSFVTIIKHCSQAKLPVFKQLTPTGLETLFTIIQYHKDSVRARIQLPFSIQIRLHE